MISLETPQRKWASSRLEGRTSWIFSSCAGALYLHGDLRDPLWWPQERQVPNELLGVISGFLSRRCRGLRPCVETLPEPEDSSPVLAWIWGISGVSPGESVLVSNWGIHVRFPLEL